MNALQKRLPAASLTDEDKFYAECASQEINLVDRVNGKPVRVYPYWIDRPRCNWFGPAANTGDEHQAELSD